MVYRFLDDFHKKGFVSVKRVVIGNRLQGLYKITGKGKKHLQVLSNTLQKLLPFDLLVGESIEDFLSGSVTPFDVMLRAIPEEERPTRLKQLKRALIQGLKQIEREITELEKAE